MTQSFNKGTGALVVDRYAFQKHINGQSFRHAADQIDLTQISTNLDSATTVQGAFNSISDFITAASNNGIGYLAVPDGYDTWHSANGYINFDNTIPSLDTVLNPVFSAIINNTTIPAGFERIKNGGVILLKAGTYVVSNTIDIPPGITLIGEGYGTKVINATSLNLATSPPTPKGSPTIKPVFRAKTDLNRSINDQVVDSSGFFMFSRKTGFFNMVIADNFVENTILGDTYYQLPQNKDGYECLIEQEAGSHVVCNDVYFVGRFASTSSITCHAIKLNNSIPASSGTILTINNCFIDGFSVPISFLSLSGNQDYLEVFNSKIRAHGYLNGNALSGDDNCFILSNDANISVKNNYLYGNSVVITAGIYIKSTVLVAPNAQARSKITISNNETVIDKTDNTFNITFNNLVNGTGSSLLAYAVTSDINNTLQGYLYTNLLDHTTGQFIVNGIGDGSFGGDNLSVTLQTVLNSNIYVAIREVTTNYPIPSSASDGVDCIILVNKPTGTVNITLPSSAAAGRLITIKDIGGAASSFNITVLRNGGTIDGAASNYVINTDHGALRLVNGDGSSSWWII